MKTNDDNDDNVEKLFVIIMALNRRIDWAVIVVDGLTEDDLTWYRFFLFLGNETRQF